MENYERTPYAGWCPTQLLPWIQNQDLKKLIALGIAMILVAGKLVRIDLFFDHFFPKFLLLFSGTAVLLGLGILEVPQSTKDAFGAIFDFLGSIKEFISLKLGFSGTADVQNTGASTRRVTRSMANRTKKPRLDTTEPESGE